MSQTTPKEQVRSIRTSEENLTSFAEGLTPFPPHLTA